MTPIELLLFQSNLRRSILTLTAYPTLALRLNL
jgi:hypothetical protein